MPSDAPKRGPRAKYSKNGCVTCSRSKVKCTEDRPRCQRCTRLDKECTWPEPRIPLRERQRGYGPLKTRLSFTSREIQPATQLALPPSPVSWSTPADPVTDEELWPGTGSPALSTPPLPPLLTLSMPSSSSVTLGQLEQDGLYYYKNVLHYAIGKEFCWSPMAIVLNKASDRGDIMHLLLAWSLFDLAHSRTYPQALQAARNHFKTGTDILLRSLHADHVDHCASIMAFWLLQLSYRAVWNTTACASMTKLSNMMLGYVQRHGLVKRMTGSQDQSDSLLLPPLSRVEQSVLGLFLLFIVYEEVAPEFGIAGGQLSRFILSNRDLSMSVLSSSRSGLEHHFGELYPPEELIDDFERSRPLELNLDANIALQRLNDIRKSGQPSIQELMQLVELIRTTKSVRGNSNPSPNLPFDWRILLTLTAPVAILKSAEASSGPMHIQLQVHDLNFACRCYSQRSPGQCPGRPCSLDARPSHHAAVRRRKHRASPVCLPLAQAGPSNSSLESPVAGLRGCLMGSR